MIKVYFIDVRKFNDKNFLSEALNNASLFRREKYDGYKFENGKKQTIAVSYLIDIYLKTMGLREKDMVYDISKYGKQSFKDYPNIKFCISHSDNFAMVTFSNDEIGCDIEKVDKCDDKLLKLVLSDEEYKDVISENDESIRKDKFFKHWVMKEAISKYDGKGLINDIKMLSSEKVYIGEKILKDINEKYYFSIYNGKVIKDIEFIDIY